MLITADRRSLSFEPDPLLLERAVAQADAVRDAELALAKTLLSVRRQRSYAAWACSSVEMFGGRLGLEGHEVRRLVRLAEAMEGESSVEERLRRKSLSVPKAVELAPVLKSLDQGVDSTPGLFEDKAEWVDRAERSSYSRVRRRARRRLAEIRCGEAVETVELRVPDSVLERFERARVLASRRAARALTRDETFETVVDHYVDHCDDAEREGTRRVGDTKQSPDSRYVPVSVKRAIRRRAGDRCEFPGCPERVHLEFAHRTPHREGGGREQSDLFLLCWIHHLMQEAGTAVPLGETADPVWVCSLGEVVTKRCPGGRGPETDAERRTLAKLRDGNRGRAHARSSPQSAARSPPAHALDTS